MSLCSYLIWCLLFTEGAGKSLYLKKSSDIFLEQLPLMICIHKPVECVGIRVAGLDGLAETIMTGNVLGVHMFRR